MKKIFLIFILTLSTLSSCPASSSIEGSEEEIQVIFTPMEETFVDAFPYVEDGYESNATLIYRATSPSPTPSEQENDTAVIYKSHTPNPFENEGWEDIGYVSEKAEEEKVPLSAKPVIREALKEVPTKQQERKVVKPKSFFSSPLNIALIVSFSGYMYFLYKLPLPPKEQEREDDF